MAKMSHQSKSIGGSMAHNGGRGEGRESLDGYTPLAKASAFSGLSVRTIRRAISSRRLLAFRPSGAARGLILLRRRDVVAWIESATIETGPPAGARRNGEVR